MKTWLISDTHFDHKNIIRYCHRPFSSVREMNDAMVGNWNRIVDRDDLVYHLGDIAFGRHCHSPLYWLTILNGQISWIKGAHDLQILLPHERFAMGLKRLEYVELDGNLALLIHNPAHVSERWKGWVIHGHAHNKMPFLDIENKRVNVSVEVIGYKPVSLDEIVEAIRKGQNEQVRKETPKTIS